MFPESASVRIAPSTAPVLALVVITFIPGATTSGCLPGSLTFPLDENSVSPLDCVPAPTATTQLGSAYGLIVGLVGPELPAAKKTAMPASWAALVANCIGVPGSQLLVG